MITITSCKDLGIICRSKNTSSYRLSGHTANEGLVRIQYKSLVPIYVLPEMKLLFPKQNSYAHISDVSVRDLYISRIGVPILLQENMWTDPRKI